MRRLGLMMNLLLKNELTTASFVLFSFFSSNFFTDKTVDLSRIQTWIIVVKAK